MLPEDKEATSEPSEKELLRTFLHGRSHPCPVCGYDLRDLCTDRCPECGRSMRLTVAEQKRVHAPFIAGLIAFAAPAGASATGIVQVFYQRIVYAWGWDYVIGPLIVNATVLALAVAALALWLHCARRLRRRSVASQWGYAAGAWAATIIGFAVCLAIS
jgi:hypothetical protein